MTRSHPLTDSSPAFIGADAVRPARRTPKPARASSSATSTPASGPSTRPSPTTLRSATRRRRPTGRRAACDFGDNPLTPAADVFVCNNKLIGGQPFLDTYNAIVGGEVYPDTARDSNGHGTHTTTTAAGDRRRQRPDLRHRPRPDQRRRPGRLGHRVQGLRPRGLLRLRLRGRRRAGHPRRRRRHQLLDLAAAPSPYSDPVELAFLDAYDAGIFVAASAGNSGPGAGTDRPPLGRGSSRSPRPPRPREFQSTLTLTDGADIGHLRRHLDHRRRRNADAGRPRPGHPRLQHAACARSRPARARRPARSSPASAAATVASRRASTSCRAARSA